MDIKGETECYVYRGEGDEVEIAVVVEWEYETYVPAYISGPPEDCYPAEGDVLSVGSVYTLDGKPFETTGAEDRELESYIREDEEF